MANLAKRNAESM